MIIYGDFDTAGFWEKSQWADAEIIEPYPDDAMIASVEEELGYTLPASYIALMRTQNGGCPVNTAFAMTEPTSWAADHIAISNFKAIGRTKIWSLCGNLGSKHLIEGWHYPPIGIYFGDCPSAGHDMICLDYRHCGPQGEPRVVHVDQEYDYKISVVADNFERFVRGLVGDALFDID